MYLTGTNGDDILVGGPDADTLLGLKGDDTLQGGDGDDLLVGGNGDDTLFGQGGDDTLQGENGDDLLIGGAGRNVIDGGAGDDTVSYADADPVGPFGFLLINLSSQSVSIIGPVGGAKDTLVSIENAIGSAGADWLVGTSGNNHLVGGAGNDNIDSRGGADVLDGGDGNDVIVTGVFETTEPGSLMIGGDGNDSLQSGNSNDTMLGGAGDDYLQIQNYAATRVVDGGTGVDAIVFGDTGLGAFSDGVFFDLGKTTAQTVAPGVVVSVSGVENVYGSLGADTLIGDANANQLRGGAGDDALHGGDGSDFLDGGFGNNVLDGGAGTDTVTYAGHVSGAIQTVSVSLLDGTASFVTGSGAVFQDTLTGIENLVGSGGADVLVGDAGDNVLQGGAGDDVLRGGAGQDTLDGDFGTDTFVFQSGDSAVAAPDTIWFFVNDRIQFIDGPAGSTANYVELETPDPAAVDALFAGEGVRYVAVQSGMNVLLYADLGDEGGAYDQVVLLAGSSLMGIDASSILGL